MTNKATSAKNYRDTLAHDIKDIRKTAEISDEIRKALSADELSLISKTRLEKAQKESWEKLNTAKGTKEYQEAKEVKKQSNDLVKKIMELTGKSKDEAEEVVYGKSDKKESKETTTKSLEFEKDTFKIESKGWKEVTNKDKDDPILGKFVGKKPKVKANATGDVVEYLDGDAKGEQIFIIYDAFIREVCKAKNCSQEVVESRYMMTIDEFQEKMKDKPDNSPEYKKFFNDEVKGHLAGYWHPDNKKFTNVGERSIVWLVGGDYAVFHQNKSYGYYDNRYFGFGGRLLKN